MSDKPRKQSSINGELLSLDQANVIADLPKGDERLKPLGFSMANGDFWISKQNLARYLAKIHNP